MKKLLLYAGLAVAICGSLCGCGSGFIPTDLRGAWVWTMNAPGLATGGRGELTVAEDGGAQGAISFQQPAMNLSATGHLNRDVHLSLTMDSSPIAGGIPGGVWTVEGDLVGPSAKDAQGFVHVTGTVQVKQGSTLISNAAVVDLAQLRE